MSESEALNFAVEAAKSAQVAAEKAAAQEPDWWAIVLKLMELGPGLLLTVTVIIALWLNRNRLGAILDRVSGFKAMGVEVQMDAVKSLSKAVSSLSDDLRVKTTVSGEVKKIRVTEDDERRVIKRADHAIDALKNRSVIWVDDSPQNNVYEVHLLELLGLKVIQVTSNTDAISMLKDSGQRTHVVISDIHRPVGEPSGIDLLESFATHSVDIPLIYYITKVDERKPWPASSNGTKAFGLTNRPDELLHLLLDVLERRWPLY